MSDLYQRLAGTAKRMLALYGRTTVISRATSASYDPATGVATPTTSSSTVSMAVFDYDRQFIDGTTVRQGDKQAFASAVTGSGPQPGDTLTWAGQAMSILAVKQLAPAGTVVMYELQLRGN